MLTEPEPRKKNERQECNQDKVCDLKSLCFQGRETQRCNQALQKNQNAKRNDNL